MQVPSQPARKVYAYEIAACCSREWAYLGQVCRDVRFVESKCMECLNSKSPFFDEAKCFLGDSVVTLERSDFTDAAIEEMKRTFGHLRPAYYGRCPRCGCPHWATKKS